jgi:hypothetical protein
LFPLGVGEMSGGEQTAQVGIALAGLGEQHQVVGIVWQCRGWSAVALGGGGRRGSGRERRRRNPVGVCHRRGQQRLHPDLGSEDRLDAALGAGLGEADRAVEAVMVGEGQGRLPELGCPGHQFLDAATTVEKGEVGVDVEVDEVVRGFTLGFA